MGYSVSVEFETPLKNILNLNYICLVAIIYEDSSVNNECSVAWVFIWT